MNFAPLNYVPLSVRTLIGMPNLYMIFYRNLTAASWVIFSTGMASINLMNVLIVTPHVSNPHDYVNHMFKRQVLLKFEI
jgi:hypothetical protein